MVWEFEGVPRGSRGSSYEFRGDAEGFRGDSGGIPGGFWDGSRPMVPGLTDTLQNSTRTLHLIASNTAGREPAVKEIRRLHSRPCT